MATSRLHHCGLALLIATLSLAAIPVASTNTYPIVLVHGFSGWGRDELLGLKYWGGIQGDLQEQLKAKGYTVYTAAVGPFSSNWDRACELYAQIKGGQVDYGLTHSTKYGHARYGRNYTGLYPAWGNTVNGKVNKIHLIGHSMGGQTIRMLAHMLEKGTTGAPVVEVGSSSPLFAGGKSWVHSITTISTPNQGTTLADGISVVGEAAEDLIVGVFAALGIAGSSTTAIYDAKLDQWGIAARASGESITAYLTRVFASSIFKPGFKDISLWSLSTPGAAEESTWVTTLSDVYYYSYATVDTYSAYNLLLQKIQLPNLLTMLPAFDLVATFIGGRYAPDTLKLSESWQANDGVVPTISMLKDSVGSAVTYSGSSVVGKWNQMTQLTNMDHVSVIGVTLLTEILDLYVAHASLLYSLPVTSRRRLEEEGAEVHEAAAASTLDTAIAALNIKSAAIKTASDFETLCASASVASNTFAQSYCATMIANAESSTRGRRLLRG